MSGATGGERGQTLGEWRHQANQATRILWISLNEITHNKISHLAEKTAETDLVPTFALLKC